MQSRVVRPFYNFYLLRLLPAFSRLASKTPEAYAYLSESIAAWPSQTELVAKIDAAGWNSATYRNLSFGVVAIHSAVKEKRA